MSNISNSIMKLNIVIRGKIEYTYILCGGKYFK